MSDIAIKLENISKFYKLYNDHKDRLKEALHPLHKVYHKKFYALKKINLEVRKGEVLGIVGRNGAGKSTLLKLISQIIQPSSGKVSVNGKVSALLELGSGLNPEFTGIQNIYFSGTMMGFSREEMKNKVDDIVNFADIGDFIDQPLKTYSSGMQARLGFALAINMNPKILILDEVLSVGDELFRRKCYARMEEFFKSGCTVLFVSHSVSAVNQICSRVILLDHGELILEGPSLLATRYYHMLLYSSPADQNAVRDEIIELNSDQERKEKFIREVDLDDNKEELSLFDDNTTMMDPQQKAYFIKGFEPQSTVTHKLYDVEIFDAQVQTLAGDRVNALVMNDFYIFSYKVKFHLDMDNVKFTMLVQDEKGLSISGVSIPEEKNNEVQRAKNGETSLIKIKFKCIMLPGNYYISASVLHINEDNEKAPLLRISDITVFKVQQLNNLNYWGVLNLGQEGEITKLT